MSEIRAVAYALGLAVPFIAAYVTAPAVGFAAAVAVAAWWAVRTSVRVDAADRKIRRVDGDLTTVRRDVRRLESDLRKARR